MDPPSALVNEQTRTVKKQRNFKGFDGHTGAADFDMEMDEG
jgi:hypothetical protein